VIGTDLVLANVIAPRATALRRPDTDGRPRRCFDLRPSEGRLFDQLELEELAVLESAGSVLAGR
jgi:hypothetical protein